MASDNLLGVSHDFGEMRKTKSDDGFSGLPLTTRIILHLWKILPNAGLVLESSHPSNAVR